MTINNPDTNYSIWIFVSKTDFLYIDKKRVYKKERRYYVENYYSST